jgi:branched-chain amino acid transport system permease protein
MTARKAIPLAAGAALLLIAPPFLRPYALTLLTQILIYALFAASAVAAVFGLIAIRATGVYFLMITLALGMVVWGLAFRWVSLTMGDNGISGIARPQILPGWSLARPIPFHYLSLFAFLVAFALLSLIVRSPFGLSLRGIRETERRMGALGYRVWLHKYLAFVLSGAFAGLAGALWAYYDGFVSPVELHLLTSVEALLMVALGGPGTLLGPALGACIIVLFKNLLSIYTKRWLLILGLVYIGVILLAPKGIVGALRGARR